MAQTPITLSEEQKKALEAAHTDLLVLQGTSRSPWVYALRLPTKQDVARNKAHAKRDEATANEQFLRMVAVFPTEDDLEWQIKQWPFAADGICISSAFRNFAGYTVDDDEFHVPTDAQKKIIDELDRPVLILKGSEQAPWTCILRQPTRQEAIGYKAAAKRAAVDANEKFVQRLCVYPPADELERHVAKWPLMAEGICDSKAFQEFIGFAVADSSK
jgi:hypothetical protein